jgi:hypothetical protein
MAVNVANLVDPKDGGAVHPSPWRAGAQLQRASATLVFAAEESARPGRRSVPAGRRGIDPAGGCLSICTDSLK